MKKFAYTILLGASALVAACTALPREEQVTLQGTPDELAFSAYLTRSTTKAGAVGLLDNTALADNGFGVFGYHTDNALYSQAALPNFMYNTKVSTLAWTYSPIKYWPNEFGSDASSESIDRLTFFAYAPYVKVNSATGALDGTEYDNSTPEKSTTTGITRLSRATDTGDPMVSYVASFDPATSVDLTWGVAKADFNKSAGDTEGKNDISAGAPYINVARPNTNDKISFSFEHALASLNVQIKADLTGSFGDCWPLDYNTKIFVRSVTFEGFADEGSLNLNSKKGAPQWVNYYGNGALSTEPVTIYDGRRDGREAISVDANEKPSNLNPKIVQSSPYVEHYGSWITDSDGVWDYEVNLFDGEINDPIYVIPNGDPLKVTISYDVESCDPKILGTYLADGVTHGSVVENTITKTISGIGAMEAGKKYVITLHLGLNSVDFDAIIDDWGAGENVEADLPASSGVAVSFTDGVNPVTSPLMLWKNGTGTRTAQLPEGYSGSFTYTSSDENVATVDPSGVVTAVGPGKAVITASATATKATEYSAVGSYMVYVNGIESVSVDVANPNVDYIGATSDITATLTWLYDVTQDQLPSNFDVTFHLGNTEKIRWYDTDPDVLTEDDLVVSPEYSTSKTAVATVHVRNIALGSSDISASVEEDYRCPGYEEINGNVTCTPPVGTTGSIFLADDEDPVTGEVSERSFYFASGNIQYQSSTGNWRFASNQYESGRTLSTFGNTESDVEKRKTQSKWIDLFGWGTSGYKFTAGYGWYQPWAIDSDPSNYGVVDDVEFLPEEEKYCDWGVANHFTYSFQKVTGEWKTPSNSFIDWILFYRDAPTVGTEENARFARVKVNSVCGLLIFPDFFVMPSGVDVPNYINDVSNIRGASSGDFYPSDVTNYNSTAWNKLNIAGAVFLPSTGLRNGGTPFNTNSGYYWLSGSPYDSSVWWLTFGGAEVSNYSYGLSYGCSVRLIRYKD